MVIKSLIYVAIVYSLSVSSLLVLCAGTFVPLFIVQRYSLVDESKYVLAYVHLVSRAAFASMIILKLTYIILPNFTLLIVGELTLRTTIFVVLNSWFLFMLYSAIAAMVDNDVNKIQYMRSSVHGFLKSKGANIPVTLYNK